MQVWPRRESLVQMPSTYVSLRRYGKFLMILLHKRWSVGFDEWTIEDTFDALYIVDTLTECGQGLSDMREFVDDTAYGRIWKAVSVAQSLQHRIRTQGLEYAARRNSQMLGDGFCRYLDRFIGSAL